MKKMEKHNQIQPKKRKHILFQRVQGGRLKKHKDIAFNVNNPNGETSLLWILMIFYLSSNVEIINHMLLAHNMDLIMVATEKLTV